MASAEDADQLGDAGLGALVRRALVGCHGGHGNGSNDAGLHCGVTIGRRNRVVPHAHCTGAV